MSLSSRARTRLVAAVAAVALFGGGVAVGSASGSSTNLKAVAPCTATNPDPTLAAIVQNLCAQASALDGYTPPAPTTTVPPTVAPQDSTTTIPPTTTTAPVARNLALWPFASSSPWNTPIGTGATYDSRTVTSGDVRVSAGNGYGICVGGAGYPLSAACNSGEGHYSIISGTTATEFYAGQAANGTVSCGSGCNRITTNLAGSGVGVGYDVATQLSQLGGLVRQYDLNNGIRHALAIALPFNVLSSAVQWPALSGDSYKASNTGFLPYGALLAIPPTVAKPAGLSAVGSLMWDAAVKYGVYVTDATGPNGGGNFGVAGFRWEPSVATPTGADLSTIGLALRWVTNSNQGQPGGPGARLAPLAP